jgi:hypothetical protein
MLVMLIRTSHYFLRHESENLPNNQNNRAYYNVHSINQFVGFINSALAQVFGMWQNNTPLDATNAYFTYDSPSQLYTFVCSNAFKDCGIQFYANSFLERMLDGFRWIYNGVPYSITDANYTGMDYQFVYTNYPNNLDATSMFWTYTSEYSTVANLLDIHSLLIVCSGGDLKQVTQQIVPIQTDMINTGQLNLPSIACLKNLDIDFNGLSPSSINNTFIQYEAPGLFYPINTLSDNGFTKINLILYIQTIDNSIYPLQLPSGGGYCNVKFVLKRLKKNKK